MYFVRKDSSGSTFIFSQLTGSAFRVRSKKALKASTMPQKVMLYIYRCTPTAAIRAPLVRPGIGAACRPQVGGVGRGILQLAGVFKPVRTSASMRACSSKF